MKKSLPLKSKSSDWYDARKQGLKCYREKATSWIDPSYVRFSLTEFIFDQNWVVFWLNKLEFTTNKIFIYLERNGIKICPDL